MAGPKEIDPGEVLANRFNVKQAALSNLLFESWEAKGLPTAGDDGEDEDDFRDMGEIGGIGLDLKTAEDISDVIRQQRTSQSKLLEKFMSKKEAEAHRKAQVAKHSASKPFEQSKPKVAQTVDADDEEEGRAAALSSKNKKRKKAKEAKMPPDTAPGAQVDGNLCEDAEPPGGKEEITAVTKLEAQEDSEEEEQKPKKRKATSYLDEMLAKSAKKKKKKNKKGQAAQ